MATRSNPRRVAIVTLLALAAARPAFAEETPVEVYRLDNGLEVVLQPLPALSPGRVAVSVAYAAGERAQPQGLQGLAWLAEQLMAVGSRNVGPGEHDAVLDRAGASERGAFTTLDDTTFFEVLPSSQLATALWLESDRMASALAAIDGAALRRARAAALEQLRAERARNALTGYPGLVRRELFPPGHPYRRAGDTDAGVRAVRLPHVHWFFQRWFAPHAARLAIAGDFDRAAARALVERYFASIRSSRRPPVVRERERAREPESPFGPVETALEGDRRVTFGTLAAARQVRVIWPTPAFLEPGDAELDLAASILGEEPRGRLQRGLVEARAVSTTVSVRQLSSELASTFVVSADVAPDRAHADVLAAIDEEMGRLCASPPRPEELEAARQRNRAREILAADDLSTRAVSLSRIRSPLAADGVYRLEHDLARYDAVTAERVQEAVCRLLPRARRLVVTVVPWNGASDAGSVISDGVSR